ncbi:hypothetical protein [Empedobacter sp. UBA5987]|uniref:hypothetical protein n=1 Tax=Empedobacter sp. UBA5987 TaxID=1946444 RepID=UPI0025B8EA5F|nr:hypothetical protein [Empedobacter sp. UBA5987]
MKKYRLLLTLFIFSIFTLKTYAQGCDPNDPDCGPPPPTNVPGKPSTRIDDYAPLLVISAISIAGFISYRQRQVIKK